MMLYTTLPLLHFLGLYFLLLNFPGLAEQLHERPLYLEDLVIEKLGRNTPDLTFQRVYNIIMNFLLAVLFAGLAEYVLVQKVTEKPLVEALGVIGGYLGLYYKVQSLLGGLVIWICHQFKERQEMLDLERDHGLEMSLAVI